MPLNVMTLGGFAVRGDGQKLVLPTKKDRALLAYLIAARGKPVMRDRLAPLLWGERAETQARDSLRQSLAAIRRSFKPFTTEPFTGDRETIIFSIPGMELDLSVLDGAPQRLTIPEFVSAYQGDFLPDFEGIGEQYDSWLLPEREKLRRKAMSILDSLVDRSLTTTQADALRSLGERMLADTNTDEALYRSLIKLEMKTGNRARAVLHYRKCCEALSTELGVQPDARTTELYRLTLSHSEPGTDSEATESPSREAAPSSAAEPHLKTKRAMIAVMPFTNISDDTRFSYLCDGIAEEIITGLGRFPALAVFDRHSICALSKQTEDVQEIGRRLGATYIIHGSVMKSSTGMRITVRLVDAGSRTQRWANTYDCTEIEILSIPERVTREIIIALHSWIEHSIVASTRRKPSLDAYEHLLRGIKHLRGYGPDDNELARDFFEKAVQLDPDYALALSYRAFADVVIHGYAEAPQDVLDQAHAMGRRAVDLDETEGRCHWVLAQIYAARGDVKAEERHLRRAISLNANDANSMVALGVCLAIQDHAVEGCALIEEAFRLNPLHPEWYWLDYSCALYAARRHSEAAEAYLQRSTAPMHFVLARLAACYAQMGRDAEAKKYANQALALKPHADLTKRLRGWAPSQAEHLIDGYRKAGLMP